MAEILWDGFKNQKLLAERAYKDEHGNNIAETYAKKTELADKVNTTAFDAAIDEIDTELESIHDWAQDTFVSGDELSDYYKKNETSAADELAAEFLKYQPTGDYVTTEHLDETLEDYAQKDELTGYYTTDNPSGFLNTASAKAVGFATEDWVEEHDYAVSSDVDTALDKKLDTTAAAETYYPKTNPAGYISEIPSEYVTETELDEALSDYTKTDDLENLLDEKQDVSGMSEYVKNADMTGYYPSNNPSGFATQNWVEGKNYALSSDVNTELDKKLDITAADDKYYPLDENPAGYLVNTDLEPYASKTDLSALDTKIGEVSDKLDNLSETVTTLSDTVSDIDDSVEQVITDIESLDEAVDVYSGNIKFISGAVDFVSANVHSLDGYALSADVDTRLAGKQDISGMSAYAQKTWVDSEYVSETELESALDEYYTKDETSAADELADEFKKYQLSGDYVTTASLESTLSEYATKEWAEDTFLTAVPVEYALSADVDTRLGDKLDTTAAAATYYQKTNPENYEENVIDDIKIAGTSMTISNKSVNFDMIPTSADSSNPLVTKTDLAAAIANFGGFKVSTGTGSDMHPDESNPDTKTIYLVKDSTTVGSDKYKEWICTDTTTSPVIWELIGDTSLDLNGYVQFPASYTAGNIVTFGTNSIADCGYTTAQMVNVQPDWEQTITGADDYIKNKPESLELVAGTYVTITGVNNQLTIDADVSAISGAMTGYANVQSDWNETNSASDTYIANKPDIIIPQVGAGVSAVPKYIMVVTAMPPAAQIDPNTIYLVQGTYIGT